MAESNKLELIPMTETPAPTIQQTMSAKTRAARIRKDLAKAERTGLLPRASIARITVKTKRASLMTAIEVKIHMHGPALVEIPDRIHGSIWKLTDDALTAVHIAEDIGYEHGATEWHDGQNTFFTVEAVENRR